VIGSLATRAASSSACAATTPSMIGERRSSPYFFASALSSSLIRVFRRALEFKVTLILARSSSSASRSALSFISSMRANWRNLVSRM